MGLTIYYSGKLRKQKDLPKLINEVADICDSMRWRYEILDETTLEDPQDDDVHGITLQPHENSEWVYFTFMPDGTLIHPVFAEMAADGNFEHKGAFTKTQFAGPDTHVGVVNLLRFVFEKYLETYKVTDDGNYWETGDYDELKRRFEMYEDLMDLVKEAIGNLKTRDDETPESLAARLELVLRATAAKRSGIDSN